MNSLAPWLICVKASGPVRRTSYQGMLRGAVRAQAPRALDETVRERRGTMHRYWVITIAATAMGCSSVSRTPAPSTFAAATPPPVAAAPEVAAAPAVAAVAWSSEIDEVAEIVETAEIDEPPEMVEIPETVGSPQPADAASDLPVMPSQDAPPAAELNQASLEQVIASVYQLYPPLDSARYARNIAAGQQLAAAGEFDLKLKAASENSPTGFYENYRHSVTLVQPTYQGGEVFAGYRVGRGTFEPWYKERETNEGGEYKAGLLVPLSRNRDIDPRRAELWRSTYERQLIESDVQAQLIGFVQEASYAYWDWVAAGAAFRIADQVLGFAEERTERVRRQVELGALDPPELTDNLRLVAERRGRRADAARKLQQSAVKLSLYWRGPDGQPLIPDPSALPGFPPPQPVQVDGLPQDTQLALQQRPEIAVLNVAQRHLEVDYAEAHNDFRPAVDAVVAASQDVGQPSSTTNDKGQFELDAALLLDVPIQRRKARGKMQAVQGKLAQLQVKRRFTEDKVVADVQMAYAALASAYEQAFQARQTVRYAEDLAQRERRGFDLGASDLLRVTLREQYAAESAEKEVYALLLYHQARADLRAAIALDRLSAPPSR